MMSSAEVSPRQPPTLPISSRPNVATASSALYCVRGVARVKASAAPAHRANPPGAPA